MKKRRLLAALAAAAMSVTMLAGCGGDKPGGKRLRLGRKIGRRRRRSQHDPDHGAA